MDHQVAMLLGEINGKLESLIRQSEEDRAQSRIDRGILLERYSQQDVLRADLDGVIETVKTLKTQVYSNKAEIDRFKYDQESDKKVDRHTIKLIGIFGSIFTAIVTGLWVVGGWIGDNWHVFSALFKAKP